MNNLKSLRQQVMFMQDHLDVIKLQLKKDRTEPPDFNRIFNSAGHLIDRLNELRDNLPT